MGFRMDCIYLFRFYFYFLFAQNGFDSFAFNLIEILQRSYFYFLHVSWLPYKLCDCVRSQKKFTIKMLY